MELELIRFVGVNILNVKDGKQSER